MGRVLHRHLRVSLVVVKIVHVNGVSRCNLKDYTPISSHRYRPIAFELPFKSMEPKTGKIQIFLRSGRIEACQNVAKPGHVLRQYAARVIFLVESL